MPTCLHDTL
jgi:hypothetical protein